uniref:Ig-like domain-containing protein n=1 Tax=Denticeps clupeoides TaxID=299321 RepID=A0AAY4AE56_9TELE
ISDVHYHCITLLLLFHFCESEVIVIVIHKSAELQCSHRVSSGSVIQWYKQSRGSGLQLLGYLTGSSPPEYKEKITLEGNASPNKNATITLKALTSSDNAVYFCAASQHTVTEQPGPKTKTQLIHTCIQRHSTLIPIAQAKPQCVECVPPSPNQISAQQKFNKAPMKRHLQFRIF